MKRLFVIVVLFALAIHLPAFSYASTSDSWIKITSPSPGIYWKGDKIFSLDNVIVMIGEDAIHVEAEGSSNIIAVYFSVYDVWNKDVVASSWDMEGGDGWSFDLSLIKGTFILTAAGAALDIEEPVVIDWLLLVAWT